MLRPQPSDVCAVDSGDSIEESGGGSGKSVGTGLERVRVIELWAYESQCWACGVWMIGARHAVPVWCDFILPNDWRHEWGGFDACPRCYEAQQAITQPMQRKAFLRSVPQATS